MNGLIDWLIELGDRVLLVRAEVCDEKRAEEPHQADPPEGDQHMPHLPQGV